MLCPLLLVTCVTSQTAIADDCSLLIASHTFDTPGGSMPEVGCFTPQDAILHGHLRLEIGVGVMIHRPLWKPLPQRSQILAHQVHIELREFGSLLVEIASEVCVGVAPSRDD